MLSTVTGTDCKRQKSGTFLTFHITCMKNVTERKHYILLNSVFFFIKSLETLDSGKLFADSVDDMDLTVKGFRYYAGWADKISGKTISAGQSKLFKSR